ncbi:response regulator [bacterium]|nr:response regulator [bacterium]
MSAERILVVEDERIVALEIKDTLTHLGYDVVASISTGEEAVELAAELKPDLILMDIHLKGEMDGIEAADRIWNDLGLPIIYLTANADEDTLQRAKITEPFGYLIKPFEEKELHTTIEMALYRSVMENKLSAHHHYLETILLSIGDAVVVVDGNGEITFMNPVAEKITGWKLKEAIGGALETVFNVVREDRVSKIPHPLRQLEGGEGHFINAAQVYLLAKDGRSTAIQYGAAPLLDGGYGINGAVVTFSDVTEAKQARDEIERLKKFNESIIQNMSEGVVVQDAVGSFTFINPAACTMLGYKAEEILDQKMDFIISSKWLADVEIIDIQRQEGVASRYEIELIDKAGTLIPVLVSGSPRYENGVYVGTTAVFTDITEIKAAEREMEKRQQYLESVLQGAPNAIITVDTKNNVLEWNPGAELMFGYQRNEVLGKEIDTVLAGNEYLDEALAFSKQISKGLSLEPAETVRYNKDGSPINVVVAGSPLWSGDELRGGVAVYTDISRLKKAEEDLKRYAEDLEMAKEAQERATEQLIQLVEDFDVAKRKAEEATHTKSEFLANMSHEIRTPMNGIMGMTDLLLETELGSIQKEYLDAVKISAESLLTIINDILDFSKIEAGRLDFERIDFSLRDCLGDAIHTVAYKASERDLELVFHVLSDVPDAIVGDPSRVRQVLLNLLSNAVKFTKSGEVVLRVKNVKKDNDQVELHFSVLDTGIGIPAEKQQMIFDAFTQADGSTTRKFGGTGLGLAISSKLIEIMGGRIWVESPVPHDGPGGPGSAFHFTAVFGLGREMDNAEERHILSVLAGNRVLIVDDNATNRRVLQDMVQAWGLLPELVEDGNKALKAIDEALVKGMPYQLALLDMNMPGMDGLSLAEKIRQDARFDDLSLIMLSSSSRSADDHRVNNVGIASYMSKPVRQQELLHVILQHFSKNILNVKKITEDTSARPETEIQNEKSGPVRILLAEDNKVNRKLAETLLGRRGYDVYSVGDGLEAVEAYQKNAFDLILMDVQMPEMDGMRATAAIRELEAQNGGHIPIVAMTAHAMKGDRERCLAGGMDDYVSKPMKAKLLYETIERIMTTQFTVPIEANTVLCDLKLDMSLAMEAVDGDTVLLKELIQEFIDEIPNQLAELKAVLNEQDAMQVERKAHSLKGAVGNFGANTAFNLAYELENLGKQDRLEDADAVLGQLENELNQFKLYFSTPHWESVV